MINDKKVFPIILTLSLIMAAILVYIQNNIGIYYWDIFLYVNNAMRMAHLGPADTLYLSPFFPAVLSVLFRLGLTGEPTVFSAAAAFYIAGVTGLYLLLRLRFSEMESLAGSISFASFSIILSWAATGALDVPAASLSIWAVYLALLGRRKDPRFYCLALPVAMAAFLTRYTSGLMLLPLAIIIFTDPEFRSKLGELLAGTGLGILLYLPFTYFFYRNVKTPFPFLKQAAGTATGSATSINPGYSLDPLYYLKHFPEYISALPSQDYLHVINPSIAGPTAVAFIIIGFLLAGMAILLWNNRDLASMTGLREKVLFILLSILMVATFGRVSFVVSEIILLLWALSVARMAGDRENTDMNLAMAVWFLSYLFMHSFHPVKVDRYLITVMPAVAYGISLSIRETAGIIRWKHASDVLSALVALLMLTSAINYLAGMPDSYGIVEAEKEAAAWLMEHDPAYSERIIASDRGPAFTWYLGKYVFTRKMHPDRMELCIEYFRDLNPDYYIYWTDETPLPSGYRVIYSRRGVAVAERMNMTG